MRWYRSYDYPCKGDLFHELQKGEDRQERRRRSIKRFLMFHRERDLYFLTQTFASAFARDNERAARLRLAPLKKCLARHGAYLTVWERGDKGNAIHAHIIFAMGKNKVTTQYLRRLMSPAGILFCKPVRYLNYQAMSRYLSAYVSKDLRYRYTASTPLRSLPPLWKMWGAANAARTGGAVGDGLLSPPRPVTFAQSLIDSENGLYVFVRTDYEQAKMDLP